MWNGEEEEELAAVNIRRREWTRAESKARREEEKKKEMAMSKYTVEMIVWIFRRTKSSLLHFFIFSSSELLDIYLPVFPSLPFPSSSHSPCLCHRAYLFPPPPQHSATDRQTASINQSPAAICR